MLLAAAVTLALVGTLSHTSGRDGKVAAVGPVISSTTITHRLKPPRDPTPPPLTVPGRPAPATVAEQKLRRRLGKAMRQAGPDSGAVVYDLDSRVELYALRPGVGRPPASVEKMWTTVGAMLKLGPRTRLRTSVLGTGGLRRGVWHGNLYLRGGGDPTFGDQTFNKVWNHGYGPTPNQLVDQLAHLGIRRVTGRIYADESLFDRRRGGLMTAYDADTPDFGGQLSALTYDHGSVVAHYSPATFAVHELALTMRGDHIAVRAAPRTARTPRRAHLLASVSSPTLSVMARLMDVPSDDLFAELFTKQLGVLFGRGGTIPDGARVLSQTIAGTYGLHPRILDGSGLSRDDRSSPAQVVDLLREAWGTPAGRQLVAALPTVGREGTVQGIGVKTPAAGNCVAKTGTLDYVTNLAGYCRARNDHTLAFALFVDGPGNGTAFTLESAIVGDIAGY